MRTRNLLVWVALAACIAVLFSAAHVMAGQKTGALDGRARSSYASKAVPDQLNYQGFLVDAADSSAVTAILEMTFRLFDSESNGTEMWSETHSAVEVTGGLFQVLLGSVTPFPAGLFDGTQLWLQTEVGVEVLAPRKPCVSVAYSHRANSAEMILDYTLTDLDDRWVNEDQVSSVTSSMITDGEIEDADISATAAIDPAKINDGPGSGLDADLLDGMEGAAFADATHQHDDRYYTEDELSTSGTINDPSNPVDWTKLKGVPAGFADGTDDVGGAGGITQILEGDGIDVTDPTGPTTTVAAEFGIGSAQVARGNHDHDADYVNEEDLDHLDAADGTPANAVYVDADGEVGIGTTAPERALHIYSGSAGTVTPHSSTGLVIENNGTATLSFLTPNTGTQGLYFGDPDDNTAAWIFYDHAGDNMRFSTASIDKMTILSNGNLGIGTGSPDYTLDVNGTAGFNDYVYHNGDGDTYLRFWDDQIDLYSGGVQMITADETTQDLVVVNEGGADVDFRVESDNNANALFVQGSDGNVGIGVSVPEKELHMRTAYHWPMQLIDGTFAGGLVLGDYDGAADEKYFSVWSNGEYLILGRTDDEMGTFWHNVQIERDGNVGIGTAPGCRLEVSTNSDTAAHFRTSWGTGQAIGCYGEATASGYYDTKGVYGRSHASDGWGYGVYGSGGYRGVYGYSYVTDAVSHIGCRGYAYGPGTSYGVYGYGDGGSVDYGVYYSNGLGGSGTKSAIVRTEEGPMAVYCQESPENWFEDFGSGEIHGGQAEVQLAGDFRLTVTINESYPLKVFITPNADIGRWWVEKGNTGFVLMAPEAPQGAQFDYRVVAKRKGYEDIRLERAPAAYADHYLYPDLDEVPPLYREEWIRSASPEVQAQYGVMTPSASPTEEEIPVTTEDTSLKKSR
jgi:hypothetical protein